MPTSHPSTGSRTTTKRIAQSEVVTLSNPEDRGYLCGRICACNQNARLTDVLGRVLRQRCVTRSVVLDEDRNHQVWRYKAEVGYDMRHTPPKPYMSDTEPYRPSRYPLGQP